MKLKDLINPELLLKISNKGIFKLKESLNQNSRERLSEITIKGIPNNIFAFSTDQEVQLSNGAKEKARNYFFNVPRLSNHNNKNEHKRINKNCDGVFVKIDDNNIEVIYCELKSKDLKAGTYEYQLINTKLLFEYFIRIYNTFYGKEYGVLEIKKQRFIVFYLHEVISNENKTVRPDFDNSYKSKYRLENEEVKMELFPDELIKKYPIFQPSNNFIEFSAL